MSIRQHSPAPAVPAPGKITVPELADMKRRGDTIVMVTAYDATGGRLADAAGVDLILVGDTVAMVVLGHESSTVPVTMDEMLFMTRAVDARRAPAARRRRHAVRLVPGLRRGRRAQRDPLRQGGGRRRHQARRRRRVADARALDRRRGHPRDGPHRPDAAVGDDARRLQGAGAKRRARRCALYEDARALEAAGCFAIVLEAVPAAGRRRTSRLRCRSRRSASAPAPAATARCSSGTTCSASTRGTRRAS